MKTRVSVFILGLCLVLFSGFTPVKTSKLKVEISGMENKPATNVWVSIFSQKDFLKVPIQRKSTIVEGDNVFIEFDLPPGEYAVSTYHDINKNDKLDRYFYGKPKEPYGFSNNIKPSFGPPKYKKCKFIIGDANKTISIKLLN